MTSAPENDAWHCEQTLLRFFRCLDEDDAEGVVREFADGGIWLRRGERLEGAAAIGKAMERRPVDRIVRHIVTNVVVTIGADGNAASESYMAAYPAPRTPDGETPVAQGSASLYRCRTTFQREGRTWRIGSHGAYLLLRAAGAGH